ncbi:MAG TPA: UbiD family decarboxylase domain-containing protein, partial [Candidatus Binatia bacterium]
MAKTSPTPTQADANAAFPFDDLRSFLEVAKEIDEYREIDGADWNREIGALTEAAAELITDPPMLIFDNIKGYPKGFRLVSLSVASVKRAALAWGLPIDKHKLELIRLGTRKLSAARAKLIPPKIVKTGPLMENVMTGNQIDMWKFPSPQFHLQDGGRYIGTGDIV